MARRRGREVTTVPATILGGPQALRGSFVLADLVTVQSQAFWTQQQNIGCVVNCIGKRAGTRGSHTYPGEAGNPLVLFVDAHNTATMPDAFADASKIVEDVLSKGKDVLVHCRETFHRGPGICAGFMQKLCGVHYQVINVQGLS